MNFIINPFYGCIGCWTAPSGAASIGSALIGAALIGAALIGAAFIGAAFIGAAPAGTKLHGGIHLLELGPKCWWNQQVSIVFLVLRTLNMTRMRRDPDCIVNSTRFSGNLKTVAEHKISTENDVIYVCDVEIPVIVGRANLICAV